MTEKWLKCDVIKGMFQDELTVTVTPKMGEPASFFVPKDSVVDGNGHTGKVKVRVFHRDQTAWAVLPSDNQEIVAVKEEDLSPV